MYFNRRLQVLVISQNNSLSLYLLAHHRYLGNQAYQLFQPHPKDSK